MRNLAEISSGISAEKSWKSRIEEGELLHSPPLMRICSCEGAGQQMPVLSMTNKDLASRCQS